MAIKSKAKEAYDLGISYSAYKIAYDRGCTDTSEFLEKPNEELEEKIAEILGQYVNLKGQHKGRDAFIKEIRKLLEYRQPVQVDGELLSEITEVSVCHMIENGGVIHSKLKEEIRKLLQRPVQVDEELVEEMWLSILSGVESDDDIHFDEKFLKAEIRKLLEGKK